MKVWKCFLILRFEYSCSKVVFCDGKKGLASTFNKKWRRSSPESEVNISAPQTRLGTRGRRPCHTIHIPHHTYTFIYHTYTIHISYHIKPKQIISWDEFPIDSIEPVCLFVGAFAERRLLTLANKTISSPNQLYFERNSASCAQCSKDRNLLLLSSIIPM